MTPDYYATLGLSPTSEDVVIRAAYLALMRRYHPDGNPSAAAAERTRAINAAYAVLSDPDRRADYDSVRAEEAAAFAPARRFRSRPTGLFAAAAIVLLLVLLPLAIWLPQPLPPPDRLADAPARTAAREPVAEPAAEPAEPQAQVPPPAIEAATAANEPPAQPLARPDQLPAPKPSLTSPPRLASAEPTRLAPTTRPAAVAPPKPALSQPAKPPLSTAASSASKPSFHCSVARTRGEIAVCGNGALASLDRQQALLYGQSWGRADAAKRARLLSTRERFIARRDSCRSTACTSGAYLARMREVSEIMTAPSQPQQQQQRD